MSYAIVGFGKIGHALAKAFARRALKYPLQARGNSWGRLIFKDLVKFD